MDLLPDKIIANIDRFLSYNESIQFGGTCSKLSAVTKECRKKLVMAKAAVIWELKQIEYHVEERIISEILHTNQLTNSVRVFGIRRRHGRAAISHFTYSTSDECLQYLSIVTNRQLAPVGPFVSIDLSSELSKLYFCLTGCQNRTVISSRYVLKGSLLDKLETLDDEDLIEYLSGTSMEIPCEYHLIDSLPVDY